MIFHNILGQNLIDFYVASWQFNWKDGHTFVQWGCGGYVVCATRRGLGFESTISHREHKVHGTKSV